jgi:hypothetical protein
MMLARTLEGGVPRLRFWAKALLLPLVVILAHPIPAQSASVSGYVLWDVDNQPGLAGVTISAPGVPSVTTDSSGYFLITVPDGWTSTITPRKDGYTMYPFYYNGVSGWSGYIFYATLTEYTIAGFIRNLGGGGIPDVVVSPDSSHSAKTDAFGCYRLRVTYGWSGTVTPVKAGYSFSPPSRSYMSVDASHDYDDYTGTRPGSILSGFVRTPEGAAVADVAVAADNGGESAITDPGGCYLLTVPDGWSGTVMPVKNRCAFSPAFQDYNNVTSDQDNQDYTVTPRLPAISGAIRTAEGVAVPGIPVSANNDGGSCTTDARGSYGLLVPEGWSGTVTPAKTGYVFDAPSKSYTNVTSDRNNQDYTGRLGNMIYVDAAARGKKNGKDWANAYVRLQDALAKALPADSIWVAEGVYWPDIGGSRSPGDRKATFQLKNNMAIYGGFPSGGEWSQRNPFLHKSILSGDINTTGVATDNSYHVVTASDTDATAILDGCVIADGYANSGPKPAAGGGLCCVKGSPQVKNCTFVGNSAGNSGGGVYTTAGNVTFLNCIFTGNKAGDGGALLNAGGTMAVINCTIVANRGDSRASLAYATTVTNSIVWGNLGRPNRSAYDDLTQIGPVRPAINFCCVQGWKESFGGEGNFDSDPLFVDAAGPDGIAGTADDDLRLQASSPCIDKGDTTAIPPEIKTDLEGKPRILNGIVDVGAHEFGDVAVTP